MIFSSERLFAFLSVPYPQWILQLKGGKIFWLKDFIVESGLLNETLRERQFRERIIICKDFIDDDEYSIHFKLVNAVV
jgi:hypothetical protein